MELTPELLGGGVVGAIIIVGAIGNYLRTLKAKPGINPGLTAIGLELGSREQFDRLIFEVKRIADALTDKNTAGINERLDELAEKLEDIKPSRRRG